MNEELETHFVPEEDPTEARADALYKKWFRTKTQQGFLTLAPFWRAGKISVDIGEVSNGKLSGSTLVYADYDIVLSYVRSAAFNIETNIFTSNEGAGVLAIYGGANTDKGPVSRLLKIQPWIVNNTPDPNSFAWKVGHFKARASEAGAFIPDMKSPLSQNMIKVTRAEMSVIYTVLERAATVNAIRG